MKKNLLIISTALALITSAVFAAETESAKDCGACEECCKDCGTKVTSAESTKQHATAHVDRVEKNAEAGKDVDC